MRNLKAVKFILSLAVVAFMFSCDESDTNGANEGESTITVRLVDAPGDYDAVNVEVVDVMIKMDDDTIEEGDDAAGWISLEANTEIVNLLDFTGGVSKVLVQDFPIPAGTLSQMRLVLGDDNTIVIKNDQDAPETFDLKTPSAQQSGLKLKVDAIIEEGFGYDFVLDFNVDESIVHAGNSGNIILKPVLYVSAEKNSGKIEGAVDPSDVPAMAYVILDDMGDDDPENDVVISANTDSTGAFALWGVPAGTYDVMVKPTNEDSDYAYGLATDVVVTVGDITDIAEPIVLMLKPGTISGTISGLAMDVVATVAINDTDGTSVETNVEGQYSIEDITPGDYTVTISATGYVTQNIDVTIDPDENEVVDATLILE